MKIILLKDISLLKESLKMPYMHEFSKDDYPVLQIRNSYSNEKFFGNKELFVLKECLFSKEPLQSYDSNRIKITKNKSELNKYI